MPRLPQLTSAQVEKLLEQAGFQFVRQKGSHRIFSKGSILIVVPYRKKPLKKGTLVIILKDAGLR